MTTNFFKPAFIVLLIVFAVAVAVWYFYLRPDYTELQRSQQEEILINQNAELVAKYDRLIKVRDSLLALSRDTVKIIVKQVAKEQQQIISEPLTDNRVIALKKYFSDFYESKAGEVGIQAPPIEDRKVELTLKETKGAELLVSDYKGIKAVNSELNKQVDYLTETGNLKQQKIQALNEIVSAKERQIVKLEKTKIPIVNSRSFWVDLGIVSGSLAVGAIIGIVYANNR